MSLERPITTIKKAIEIEAQKLASDENLIKPEEKHYKEVLNSFKKIRNENPTILENRILLSIKTKEVKNELGAKLDLVLQEAFNRIESKFHGEIIEHLEEIVLGNHESADLKNRQILLFQELLKKINNEVKNDPEVVRAFEGKDALLEKALEHTLDSIQSFDMNHY